MSSLNLDSSKGGNGDIWMRLVGFYAISKLLPDVKITLKLSPVFSALAPYTFGDRLLFDFDMEKPDLIYTNLGMKDLLSDILKGQQFISPYQRAVMQDRRRDSIKDKFNSALFDIADYLGVIQLPASQFISKYQAYLDIIGIKKLRSVSLESFVDQLAVDLPILQSRLSQSALPVSNELFIPDDLKSKVIVFPTGTGRQFVPIWWAKEYLPDAYYSFFYKDPERIGFEDEGLKVLPFYKEPGDIIKLAKHAHWSISTDSFPSHLLQTASLRTTIALTVFKNGRTVSPIFKGRVIDSMAPCAPCIHLDKNNHPKCAAGYTECLNWKNKTYTQKLLNSIPSFN